MHRLAEYQEAVRGGKHCCAMTCSATQIDYQLHPVSTLPELNAVMLKAPGWCRDFLGVAYLTSAGPRVLLAAEISADEISALSAAYIAHVAAILTTTMQQSEA